MSSSKRITGLTTTYQSIFSSGIDGPPFIAGSVEVPATSANSVRVQVEGIHNFSDATDYYLLAVGAIKQFGVKQASGRTGAIGTVQARADSGVANLNFDVDFR